MQTQRPQGSVAHKRQVLVTAAGGMIVARLLGCYGAAARARSAEGPLNAVMPRSAAATAWETGPLQE